MHYRVYAHDFLSSCLVGGKIFIQKMETHSKIHIYHSLPDPVRIFLFIFLGQTNRLSFFLPTNPHFDNENFVKQII